MEQITVPPEVQRLLDLATPIETSPYGVSFDESRAYLLTSDGKNIVETVEWAEAGRYRRFLLNAALPRP